MTVRSFYWDLVALLMRDLMTLILMTLLGVAGGALFLVRNVCSLLTMALHLHSAALHLLSNNDCTTLLHVAGHCLIAAHVLIVGAALRFVRVGALSLVLGLSN